MKTFKVTAHFPIDKGTTLQVRVEAGSWPVAVGAAARALRKLPQLKRRRVSSLSLVVEQMGDVEATETQASPEAAQTVLPGVADET